MPFRKTYQINNREQGKVAQRDQSYRSCLIALLIFFFLCLILILACIPWKIQNQRNCKGIQCTEQHRYQERTKEVTIITIPTTQRPSTERVVLSSTQTTPKIVITSTTTTKSRSTEDINVITEDYLKKNVKGFRHFERYFENKMNEITSPTPIVPEVTDDIDDKAVSISQSGPIISTNTSKYTTVVDIIQDVMTSKFVKKPTNDFTDRYYDLEKSEADIMTNTLSTQSNDLERNAFENSTKKFERLKAMSGIDNYEDSVVTEVNAMIINETVTEESSPVNYTPFIDVKFSTTKVKNKTEDIMNKTTMSTKSYTEEYNVTFNGTEKYSIPVNYNENLMITTGTTVLDEDMSICTTGHCKYIASRMLSYMNHSVDPCEDFYEYACGGFEANPQLIDENLVRRSRNYQRIANQMLKEKRENVHSTFATYYDSCVQYEKNMNFSERIKMANDTLRKIGRFYEYNNTTVWGFNYMDFTNLLAQLMLHHSALLFDVVPELDEYYPNNFTLKISPTTYESPFKTEHVEDPCFEDKLETKGQYVDLEILYNNYKECKNDTSEFIRSVRKALTELNVFKELNLEWNIQSEYIEKTVYVIESVIMQEYFSNFPSKSEMREAYLMNDYSKVTLEDLQNNSTFINWAQLIHLLTGLDMITNASIQVYFYPALTKGLYKLEKYAQEDPIGLNNAIMGLYAHRLYQELVLPKRDNVKDYCLHVATYLLQLEASSLYISSFTDHEIVQMNQMIEKTFNDLKRTLSINMQEAQWAKEEGREELLKKISSLKLTLPVVSYFKNRNLLYDEYNVSEIILDDNYFNNSMILLKRYRTLIYAEPSRQVGDPQQIWTYYATPFQSKARTIYALNLVVIPYGVIDWSLINDELSFDYLVLATLGNLIAHQIAHHFDANGIHYWDQTKNTQDSLMFENEFTNAHFDDYVNCQKENMYQKPIKMTLPFTDQIVSFTIPRLTLNERLSEIMGLRLAYDTLAFTRSDTKRLPWIQLRINQLFYLAYAQMYCTKMPLTSSYVSLYESGDLPNRIRVFVSASNNKLLGEAWKCASGSQIAPNDICNVFPYIETEETAIVLPE
ncbi:neprilysin-1 [Monomorium pharaonis]|uniref:neprilysin-1 n=1 Tax=Monomorium pharaonis TaxID=307658 RepID=UPI00063F82D3|nr:neprilysin-1 [Monomorium pharaonis]